MTKETWFYKPHRCVQGWKISIAKLFSKDKFYCQLLCGMSLQFWGFSTETLKYEKIPNIPTPQSKNTSIRGCYRLGPGSTSFNLTKFAQYLFMDKY